MQQEAVGERPQHVSTGTWRASSRCCPVPHLTGILLFPAWAILTSTLLAHSLFLLALHSLCCLMVWQSMNRAADGPHHMGVGPVGYNARLFPQAMLPQAMLQPVLQQTDEEDSALQASWSTISCGHSMQWDAECEAEEQMSRGVEEEEAFKSEKRTSSWEKT